MAKKILVEEGYPNGFSLTFANTALPGTQFMVDIGTAIADMWTKVGVKVNLKHYEWGSFAPLVRGEQTQLIGAASMYRTVGRPDLQWRYNAAFSPQSDQKLLGDTKICDTNCKEYIRVHTALLDERDLKKRTELTDAMVKLIAESWVAVPIIEGMGYYAVNKKLVGAFKTIPGRHELGDVFERIPRADQAAWPK